jgi:sugar phosphate isomerase/epimerase
MRLGIPLFEDCSSPELWTSALKRAGYSAAFCPVGGDQSDDVIKAYVNAAKSANIEIAEVGAWSNPMSPDNETRRLAILNCQKQLALADKIGARCCVNISGSRGSQWDGPHPDNLTEATFDMIVETVRTIIDEVKPTRTFYTLETMPWMYPDSADSCLRLIKAIDRKSFAAHFDPVNLICSPQRYYGNAELIKECFAKFGQYIKSCHAKDTIMSGRLTTHIDETRPGLGNLDYHTYLQEINKLDPDTTIMVEHLPNAEEYKLASDYIRSVAKEAGITIK